MTLPFTLGRFALSRGAWMLVAVLVPLLLVFAWVAFRSGPLAPVRVTAGAKQGWDISEPRVTLEGVDLSVMPPCAVYTTVARKGIEVTKASYSKRLTQIGRVLSSDVRPDVIAFQEVSGAQAVREALGPASVDYNVCSFDSAYKVQRLAFAWKKALGNAVEACTDVKAMSLPQLAPEQRVRPGYVVTLNLRGKKVRLFTVHLKSGCVSSLEGDRLDGNVGANDPCPILQQQVQPLEEVWEQLPIGVDYFIVLGDFNRNLWHEANKVAGSEPVRSDSGTDLTTPLRVMDGSRTLSVAADAGDRAAARPAVEAAGDESNRSIRRGTVMLLRAARSPRSRTSGVRRQREFPVKLS